MCIRDRSDVVELYDDSGSEFYYCDRVGFQPIRFEQKQDPVSYTHLVYAPYR